jgi:hypothetical protein
LTKYEVNGIDSLDLLNNYFPQGNPTLVRDIRKCEFVQREYSGGYLQGEWYLGGGCILTTGHSLTQKDKKMKIFLEQDSNCIKKNIFLNSEIEWTILNFPTKKKNYLKIKTVYENGNTYKIQISRK